MDDNVKLWKCILSCVIALIVGLALGIWVIGPQIPSGFTPIPYDILKTLNPENAQMLRNEAAMYLRKGSLVSDTDPRSGRQQLRVQGRVPYKGFPALSRNLPFLRFQDFDDSRKVLFPQFNVRL